MITKPTQTAPAQPRMRPTERVGAQASVRASVRASVALLTALALTGCDGLPGGGAMPWLGPSASRADIKSGAELYAVYCAACHGATGAGDGPSAAGLNPRPADLRGLSAANGGTFPMVAVMSQIDGYTQAKGGVSGAKDMPKFGALLEGDTVLLELNPGEAVPTPERLVRLAEYVATLQDTGG